jgi:hypothetical protein
MNCGLDNNVISFKNRIINMDSPVEIYRNLHGCGLKKYSIRQNGLVVGHTNQIMLRDAVFKVSKAGKLRVRKEKRKNVHALIVGTICENGGMGTTAADKQGLSAKITYNPYEDDSFMCKNLTTNPFPVHGAVCIILNSSGVSGAYLH